MERSDFPEVGTRLTYGEAIPVHPLKHRSLEAVVCGDRLPVRQLYLNGRPYGLYP